GLSLLTSPQAGDVLSASRANPCRLFRMPLTSPVGLDSDSEAALNDAATANDRDLSGDSRVKVAVGTDNPFFDFRRPGDPGGVGFYRLHSQMQLFGNQKTGLSLGLQAVTPAGLEADGVSDGPTVLSPNFAWFHQIRNGTAIQGFV